MNIADELRKLADRIETPDPYAELKKAHAEGRAIEQVGHSSGDWFACGSDVAWTRPPECYRIKPEEPWTLGRELPGFRALRDGEEWHFAGKWRREWLPSGCRPLLVGEDEQYGDEAIFASGEIVEVCQTTQPDDMDLPRRTKRPLPILKASQIADERRGVPSASGMQRIVNCPASFRMEQASYAEPESKDASAGTLIHVVLAGLANYDDLTPEQQQTCDMCEGAMDRAFRDWAGGGAATLTQKEVRLGLTVDGRSIVVTPEETAEFVFTGQYDRLCIIGDRAIVMDTKTGRGDYEAAMDNDQLAALADLVHLHHKVNHVRVVLAQPWRKNGVTVADYTPNIWPIVHTWLIDSVHGAMNATPDQTKEGPWCKFCRAKLGCKTYNHRLNQNFEVVDPLRISGLAPKEQGQAMWAILMEVSPERLVAAVNGLPFHKRFIHAVESTFMARVEAGEIPGYQIEAKPGNREITDAQAAFNALQPLGITSDDVLAACKLPLGAMEEAARKASGIKSQTPGRTTYNLTAQQAKDSVNAALEAAGAIGRKAEGRQIVKIQPTLEEGAE